MNKKESIEGKQAFPLVMSEQIVEPGLSERRYYIGQALQGMCAMPSMAGVSFSVTAKSAIAQADAVMALLYPDEQELDDTQVDFGDLGDLNDLTSGQMVYRLHSYVCARGVEQQNQANTWLFEGVFASLD